MSFDVLQIIVAPRLWKSSGDSESKPALLTEITEAKMLKGNLQVDRHNGSSCHGMTSEILSLIRAWSCGMHHACCTSKAQKANYDMSNDSAQCLWVQHKASRQLYRFPFDWGTSQRKKRILVWALRCTIEFTKLFPKALALD